MLEAIGDTGLWGLVKNYEDKHALVTCVLATVRVSAGVEAGAYTCSVVPFRAKLLQLQDTFTRSVGLHGGQKSSS
jgi:hypothetical protein